MNAGVRSELSKYVDWKFKTWAPSPLQCNLTPACMDRALSFVYDLYGQIMRSCYFIFDKPILNVLYAQTLVTSLVVAIIQVCESNRKTKISHDLRKKLLLSVLISYVHNTVYWCVCVSVFVPYHFRSNIWPLKLATNYLRFLSTE